MSSRFPSGIALCFAAVVAASPVTAREMRVCADPNNLPFSKQDGSGFENKIADIIADELGATVTYTWFAQRRGFLRNTLNAGVCDVVIGYPRNYQILRSTRPYYRSSYVFVQRAGEKQIAGYDDPALRQMQIGVQLIGDDGANTPPVAALAKRGMTANVHGYPVYGDYRTDAPLAPIVDAVSNGTIDVAIVWGPTAGYFARREKTRLKLTPILFDSTLLSQPMTFDIAVGVRKNEIALSDEIDRALRNRRNDVDAVLQSYGVPRTDTPDPAPASLVGSMP
ncbi:MAG TPA: substrate-binding domain-containing protein [Hyphomicrobium sp.]|nr:substrate-binding domain-containing protein [Hyphomicrobium sp.]